MAEIDREVVPFDYILFFYDLDANWLCSRCVFELGFWCLDKNSCSLKSRFLNLVIGSAVRNIIASPIASSAGIILSLRGHRSAPHKWLLGMTSWQLFPRLLWQLNTTFFFFVPRLVSKPAASTQALITLGSPSPHPAYLNGLSNLSTK